MSYNAYATQFFYMYLKKFEQILIKKLVLKMYVFKIIYLKLLPQKRKKKYQKHLNGDKI